MLHDPFDNNNSQLELSYELLCFLQWLMINEQEHDILKDLIEHALQAGLKDTSHEMRKTLTTEKINELQSGIVEFFTMLDRLLFEVSNEQKQQTTLKKHLAPTIQQIDTNACDSATIQCCVQQATSEIERHPEKNPKKVLYEALLRRWRPSKKTRAH